MKLKVIELCCILCLPLSASACGPDVSNITPEKAGLQKLSLGDTVDTQISTLSKPSFEDTSAVVVLVHGTPGSAEGWVDMLSQTPAAIHAIAIDRPGYGTAQQLGPQPSLKVQAEAALAAVRGVQTLHPSDVPVVLVGHSYGAPVAVKAAMQAPDEIDAIVLAAGALDPDLEEIHWAQTLATWQPVKFLIGKTLRAANAELLALERDLIALAKGLEGLSVPVFIIHGDEDELVPVANVAYMLKSFPPNVLCETLVLDGQNHFLPWNEIDAMWGIIERASDQAGGAPC